MHYIGWMVSLPKVTYLNTAAAWQRAVPVLSREPAIALDIEANSLYAYRERVCLIQISIPSADYILDPLAGFEFPELGVLLRDPAIEKVFHACEYDLLLLRREFSFEVVNLFDTMWAARILGYTHMGLAGFLEEHFGVTMSKKLQKANWGARPLTQEMLEYAQTDTHYLLRLREIFAERIEAAGRTHEALEIFANACHAKVKDREPDPDAFWRVKGSRDLRPRAQAILKALAELRESEAKRRDLPPFKVLPNHILLDCAVQAPVDIQALAKLPTMSPRIMDRYGDRLMRAINEGRNAPLPKPPVRQQKSDPDVVLRFEKLTQWRKELAQARGVESDVILPKQTLWEIAKVNPRSVDELADVKSLGPKRLQLYGDLILTQITEEQTAEEQTPST